jgi:ribosomal protein L11 methylase PrmA
MVLSNLVSVIFLVLLIIILISIIKGGPYVPSDKKTIERMIKLLKIKKGEKAVDIGSGDGRIVIALANAGAKAYGYEVNPLLVYWARYQIWRQKLSGRAYSYWKSFWSVDLSDFDVVTVYAISYVMDDLGKKLIKELKPGARVVSHTFKFPEWKPVSEESGVYLYKV